ncbi:CCHC-type domain-containing protein [Trichonephila clavipes]|nr:CCHC-type domain-containing protein [Trichonephila clavipes]
MEIIKRNKTAQRTAFTKAYTKLESVLINENADAEEIDMCLHLLKQKSNSLELTHNNYLDALTDETEFKIEFNIIEEYREKALRIELKSKRVLENIKSKQNNNEGSNSGNNSHLADCKSPYKAITPRLPEVELYKFVDIQENTGPIEVLLGVDVAGKLITGRREELKTGLVALETKLGWTLMGKVPRYTDKKDTSMNIVTMLSQEDIPVSSLWDLEMLRIRDTIEQNSREEKEKAVMSHILEAVRQKEDGRYEVHMPWKVDRVFLTDNYELCLKRLESTTRKLEKISFREKYHEVFREWLAEGVIEEIPGKELPVRTHYLPHRPVIKETSATSSMKIRPVFDASAKINNHPSLNDCLETGNNLIESVPAILARFRLKPIGVISDIRRDFLQISLHEKDRDFVRFLWYDNEGNIRTYRHSRVDFGVTSSPFLLMAVINYHLLKESVKERYSKEFLKKLQDSFYVDNCVTSVQNNAELRIFIECATNVMKEGMFDLRGWESSAIPSESTTSLVLGLIWDKNSDTLEIDSEPLKFDEKEKITKRKILSLVSRVFDPIGFLAPVMIQPKILLQTTWKTKEAWDDEVNDEIRKKFLKNGESS